jgi:hypothetical protein
MNETIHKTSIKIFGFIVLLGERWTVWTTNCLKCVNKPPTINIFMNPASMNGIRVFILIFIVLIINSFCVHSHHIVVHHHHQFVFVAFTLVGKNKIN